MYQPVAILGFCIGRQQVVEMGLQGRQFFLRGYSLADAEDYKIENPPDLKITVFRSSGLKAGYNTQR